ERSTVAGRAHLLLARLLRSRSPAQARLSYRLAMTHDRTLVGAALAEGAATVRTGEDALQLVPRGELSLTIMARLVEALRTTAPEAALHVEDELARLDPSSPIVARARARRALEALATPACAEDRPRCLAAAEAAAGQLVA